MGHYNQLLFAKQFIPTSPGRILEIGSKQYGSTQGFREAYGGDYVGLDLESGPGVDVVADLTEDFWPLEPESFDLVICCSVLEHVPMPWKMAANIMRLMKPKAQLYVSAPWVWRYHAYPDDYFRFSWRGIEALFSPLRFGKCFFSTNVNGEIFKCDPEADAGMALKDDETGRKYLPYLEMHGIGRKP
jgi:SAM-dependent methyltransferase